MRRLIVLMVVAAASAGAVGQARSQQIELDGPAVFLRGVGFSITMTAPTATAPVRVTARFADGRLLADTVIAPGSSVGLGDVVVERGSAAPLRFTAAGEVSLMARPALPGWFRILPPLGALAMASILSEVSCSLFAGARLAGLAAADDVTAACADDADRIRAVISEQLGAEAVIPSNPSRAGAIPMDEELYKERHLIECVRPAHSDQWRSGPHSTKSNATGASH